MLADDSRARWQAHKPSLLQSLSGEESSHERIGHHEHYLGTSMIAICTRLAAKSGVRGSGNYLVPIDGRQPPATGFKANVGFLVE